MLHTVKSFKVPIQFGLVSVVKYTRILCKQINLIPPQTLEGQDKMLWLHII